jgi:uncharacterized protein (DUF488 family)
MPKPIMWTVGHSNHGPEVFVDLVRRQRIDRLLDVRSHPYSRFAPHFNREELQAAVEAQGIHYAFLGTALGGRPRREDQIDAKGRALYDKMAQEAEFREAIDQLLGEASEHRLALMCGCGRPEECHRRLLVGKVLCDRGAELRHILPDGSVLAETSVALSERPAQESLFGHDEQSWRSTRSVLRRRPLSTSSHG